MVKKLITIIAPMYNEELVVEKYTKVTIEALQLLDSNKYCYEILFINDGSQDNTLREMLKMQEMYPLNCGIVNLSRNFGLEGAVHAGLQKANGNAVIVMDADLQDPPELIIEMVRKWENGSDIVIASRESRSKDSFFKRFYAGIYYFILDWLSGKLKLEKDAANFRLLSRKAVDQLLALPEVNTYFRVNVPFIGMKTDIVKYDRKERVAGKTKYNFVSLIRCALDGLSSISIEPLRKILIFIPFMFVLSLIGIIIGIFTDNMMQLFSFIFASMGFFFMLVFICLFVIGEYIGQIMVETRHRPTSIIYEYLPSKNSEKYELF